MRILLPAVMLFLFSISSAAAETVQTTARDQTGLEVTVYNSNLGLVKDLRSLSLGKGGGELRFMDVASAILPESVRVASRNHPSDLAVLEQNYEYDLMSEQKLLEKYVGRTIRVIDANKYQDRKDIVEAEVLAVNGTPIYRIDGEIYLGHPGIQVLPELPENLIAKPTLAWLYENQTDKPHELEVSYLTQGLTWKADYVLVVDGDDEHAGLSGWVTVNNHSGAAYRDAHLKLVAGELNRMVQPRFARDVMMMAEAKSAGAPAFEEHAFDEYHIYDLGRRTTLKENQSKQIRLLEASGLRLQKHYRVQAGANYWGVYRGGEDDRVPVQVLLEFRNTSQNRLGMPLPAGTFRIYREDHEGSQQFAGEDSIRHTPKDEIIRLKTGHAFDIVAEKKQTDYRQLSRQLHESVWEITLRNHKDKKVTVDVVETLAGNWKIIEQTHNYEKTGAFEVSFRVEVPAGGEAKVRYRIQNGL